MLEGPCLKADEVLLLPLSARYSSTGSTDSSPYCPTACISTGNVGHYSASSINQCPSLMRDASASNLGGGETIDFPRGPSSPCVVGRSIIRISTPLFDSLNARSHLQTCHLACLNHVRRRTTTLPTLLLASTLCRQSAQSKNVSHLGRIPDTSLYSSASVRYRRALHTHYLVRFNESPFGGAGETWSSWGSHGQNLLEYVGPRKL